MKPSAAKLAGATLLAVTAVSSAAVVILLAAPLAALTIAGGRVAVTGLALLALGRRRLAATWSTVRRELAGRTALAAALLAVHFGTWIASLTMTTVVRSVTLVATQPLLAGVLARATGDRVSWRLYAGGAVAVAGTAVMIGGGDEIVGPQALWGDVLAVVAAAAAAGYLAVGRSVRAQVDLAGYLSLVHLGAALILGVTIVAFGLPLADGPVQTTDWLAVIYLGLVPGVIGHGLLNWAVRFLPVHTVSLAILLEPLGATALAVAILGRTVVGSELLGAAIIGVGVGVALWRARAADPLQPAGAGRSAGTGS